MDLIQDIHKKASKRGKRIVLPEGSDDRMFSAAEKIVREGICEVTLLGSPEVLQKRAKELGVSLTGVHLMEPGDAAHKKEFAKTLFDLRKHKGMTPEEGEQKIVEPL